MNPLRSDFSREIAGRDAGLSLVLRARHHRRSGIRSAIGGVVHSYVWYPDLNVACRNQRELFITRINASTVSRT
jgi:hypothetical protein